MAAKIIGIENLSVDELNKELEQGGRFVIFEYCYSIIIMTVKHPTDIYFIKGNHSALRKSFGYTLLSLLLGWWGFPWGPIHTIGALVTNLKGGKDVTRDVIASFNRS